MFPDYPLPPESGERQPAVLKSALIPALACAVICIVMMRAGFFSLFFLVPLGFCAVAFGSAAAWRCFVFTLLGHGVLTAVLSPLRGTGILGTVTDILYFAVLALGFTWIMAGNPPDSLGIQVPKVRTAFRFTAAAVTVAVVFFALTFAAGTENLLAFINFQTETISSAVIASAGADPARQSVLERTFAPERITQAVMSISLRGGVLFSAFFLFFLSRQTALVFARLFRKQRENISGDLSSFHVPRNFIWVFSFSLLAVLIFRRPSLEIAEIAAWNLLVICTVMYLAQGGGIVLFALSRRPMPGPFRVIFVVLLIITIFSPGINIFALGALILLGIAENWLPLRRVNG